jgi:hypothetical protein
MLMVRINLVLCLLLTNPIWSVHFHIQIGSNVWVIEGLHVILSFILAII